MTLRRVNSPKHNRLFRQFTVFLIMSCILLHPLPTLASKGTPNSDQFGYGARLDPLGEEVDLALKAADAAGLDWIGIDFDWARLWHTPQEEPNLVAIDFVMRRARRFDLQVLISLTNPPQWAKTAKGPDRNLTAYLVRMLAERYQQNDLSFELFPAANTSAGWGSSPDPIAYKEMLRVCWEALQKLGSPAILVGAGLQPVPAARPAEDWDDLKFLAELYEAGAVAYMPVVGMRLPDLSLDPMAFPNKDEPLVLRRYEKVRQVMLQHNHKAGLIWITGFQYSTHTPDSQELQARWITHAYQIMRSQLYLGTAFLDGLNPPTVSPVNGKLYLIRTDGKRISIHPALNSLAQLITLDRSGQPPSGPWLKNSFPTGVEKWKSNPEHP